MKKSRCGLLEENAGVYVTWFLSFLFLVCVSLKRKKREKEKLKKSKYPRT